ncbi:HIRAN domain-containing protein [Novosphingobium sp. KN65.2]|uniref:HIRAN domain-containing protein n=1 Tax=Novosphingobium sp. KN65.2 TaxID=1478134 RepID=UPI001E406016|nr:HIRAN domain-containing protein [Novosphingobium sp. KN65.2]
MPQLSLAVVGADYENKRGPTRRFEISMCKPGEPIELRLEPDNPADPRAVAIYSTRGIQLGYVNAERCGRIGKMIREGRIVTAVFQEATRYGAAIRVAFDSDYPKLPEPQETVDQEPDWYPDEEWPDD